ncbi:MAG: zinc ribbon domain-containing protein [Gammaproteobacteria bacterium]|nr:zinc ribbon domain-containing protein [Gammaproteobacteria bacterium]CAJ2376524.1 MAG: FmdB family transcriptional regulator [Arenicellales bacterium IbO2]MDA7962545.1 zinc ribbon domain-containing protein [Gammaproteobacteria bacterium]MDA7969970.1 zinc ribbon domain-containing protein [Gammaproteobacteria bacterium]MDA7971691.1 zinc ribbon domain-containing protein [Gammaproteobacteria bacterium]
MPIYEYQCDACGHHLEALQKISEEPLRACPQCGGDGLKKLVSKSAFRLKGGGWYETDFKHGGAKKDASKDKSPAAEKSAAKSDSGKSPSEKPKPSA